MCSRFLVSGAGYKYIFTLNPKGLLDIKLWIYAFGQAFFSLSIAGNGTVIYGSYLSDKENIVSSAEKRSACLIQLLRYWQQWLSFQVMAAWRC